MKPHCWSACFAKRRTAYEGRLCVQLYPGYRRLWTSVDDAWLFLHELCVSRLEGYVCSYTQGIDDYG